MFERPRSGLPIGSLSLRPTNAAFNPATKLRAVKVPT
jgi:hypothetical protein